MTLILSPRRVRKANLTAYPLENKVVATPISFRKFDVPSLVCILISQERNTNAAKSGGVLSAQSVWSMMDDIVCGGIDGGKDFH
jgi:hypothetical protein